MKLELVSYQLCPFVHRATTMLNEKGAEYEIKYIDLAQKPDWFLKISPRGKVPVLLADGTPIFESSVICEFLDETQPPRLLPEDALERARQRAWVEVANDLFAADYETLYSQSEEEFQAGLQASSDILGRFEESSKGPFFSGDRFGLVDVAAAPVLFKFVLLERHSSLGRLDPYPKVRGWAERIAERPSVIHGVVPDFEERYLAGLKKRASYFARTRLAPT